jgi:CRP-like cAMP-binding protein
MNEGDRFSPQTASWLLHGLDEDDKQLAARILEGSRARFLPAGFRGSTPDLARAEALLVESGFAVVRSSPPSVRPMVVAEAGAGSILLPPSEREHLHALTECWVTALPPDVLDGLLAVPSAATALFRGFGAALRLRQDATTFLASVRHVDRIRQKLLQLAREFGRVNPDGIRLEFPLTHDLLAEMVASARETVTRALDDLHRSGFVVRDGHSYKLLVPPDALDQSE